jgi:hypothetical protein
MRKLSIILAALGAIAASGLALRRRARNRRLNEADQHESIPGQFSHPHHEAP